VHTLTCCMLTPNIFITVLLFTPLIYHDEKRATKLSVCLAVLLHSIYHAERRADNLYVFQLFCFTSRSCLSDIHQCGTIVISLGAYLVRYARDITMHVVTAQQLILQTWQLKPFRQVSVIYASVISIQINHKYLLSQSQTRGAIYTRVNLKYPLWQSQTRGSTYTRVYTVCLAVT